MKSIKNKQVLTPSDQMNFLNDIEISIRDEESKNDSSQSDNPM